MSFVRRLQIRLRAPMRPVVRFFAWFFYQTHFVDGDAGTLQIGQRVGLANTLFNLSSGSVYVEDFVIFGYNVMVITGRHEFVEGKRASIRSDGQQHGGWGGGPEEVPSKGYDIRIGTGSWIASGAIITGGVTIGKHAIVAASAVVTSDIPDYGIAAGIPARVIGDTRNRKKTESPLYRAGESQGM